VCGVHHRSERERNLSSLSVLACGVGSDILQSIRIRYPKRNQSASKATDTIHDPPRSVSAQTRYKPGIRANQGRRYPSVCVRQCILYTVYTCPGLSPRYQLISVCVRTKLCASTQRVHVSVCLSPWRVCSECVCEYWMRPRGWELGSRKDSLNPTLSHPSLLSPRAPSTSPY